MIILARCPKCNAPWRLHDGAGAVYACGAITGRRTCGGRPLRRRPLPSGMRALVATFGPGARVIDITEARHA